MFETGVAIKRGQRRKIRRLIAIGAAAAVVAAGGIVAGIKLTAGSDQCGAGVVKDGAECVGVTDGSYVFDPALTAVEGDILGENRAVAQETRDYVTLALFMPLTYSSGSDVSMARIRAELEGAYAAQSSLNGQGFRPAIRLLLANEGSTEQAWSSVAGELADEPASDNLVAVVGMGVSTLPTVQAARQFAGLGDPLPMIGTVITADGLDRTGPSAALVGTALAGPIKGLVRVVPGVDQEVEDLLAYLRQQQGLLTSVLLVKDTNQADLYTESLGQDFQSRFATYHERSDQYDGSPGSQVLANEFTTIADAVCLSDAGGAPPTVLYAGREELLPTFIDQLRGLTLCHGSTITVVTGSDADALPLSSTEANPTGPQINVVYADIVDATQLSPAYTSAFRSIKGVVLADLDDAWAAETYDGVAAAELAVRDTAGASSTVIPNRGAVMAELYDLNTPGNEISGATGEIQIQPNGDESCEGVPIVTDSGGSSTRTEAAPQPGCQ
ncbi:MAG TPA: hypothetical protein VGM10_21155 [Actinocrinis sp.]|jgi:hypothetical protein